jgi:hypothetical protein
MSLLSGQTQIGLSAMIAIVPLPLRYAQIHQKQQLWTVHMALGKSILLLTWLMASKLTLFLCFTGRLELIEENNFCPIMVAQMRKQENLYCG